MTHSIYRLGDVCRISTGQSAPQDSDAFGSTGHPFVRAGSLERLVSGYSEQTLELVVQAKADQYRLRLFPAGTIVFAKSGMSAKLGRIHMLSVPCYVVSHLATVEPSSAVHGRWLLHWFRKNSPTSLIANESYPSIRTSEIEALKVALPEIGEQQRIATILDKADRLRRKRLEAIRLADEFLRAAYLDLAQHHPATVPVETLLADVPNSARTGPFGSQLLVSEFTKSGISVLGIDNVVSNGFTWGAPRFISAEKYAELERYTVRPGDVMVSIMGTTGRVAIAPDDLPICISTKHLCTLTLDHKKMLPTYLWACLRWDPDVRAQTLREAKGAIMEGWNMGIVKGLLVNSPPMDVQVKFEESANRIKRMRSAQALAAKGTDELIASLSAKYLESTT